MIEVGNLDAVRDFTDVRDVVRAYRLLLEKGEAGQAYNVCSGRGRRIREVLDLLLAGSSVRVEVRVDKERLRPVRRARPGGRPLARCARRPAGSRGSRSSRRSPICSPTGARACAGAAGRSS